ncbi:uncharacterized protein DFL_004240 [Arthrobotrys flagrans]|uniref:Uncharacterized protein n=1 Tax=Arthrobotrys flagrans TaxID=97331 RepID=A0A437A4C3_ARTFL|nr:hypothetical protein DFL_004240 [Arthrobotrys flagrans]
MSSPAHIQCTSSLSSLLATEIPSYPTSRTHSPLFYTSEDSEDNDELIYPHEDGDSENDSLEDTEDGDAAVLYGSTFDLGSTYSASINLLRDEDASCLNFTNFDDVPVDLRKAWVEQWGFIEGDDENDGDDLENHEIETATVGRVFRANSVTMVDVEEHKFNV